MIKLAKVLYGSQNYGTDCATSDKDYKVIVAPEGNELFKESFLTGGSENESLYDFRTFVENLKDGRLNALELMVSQEIEFYDEDFQKFYKLMQGDITDCFAAWNAQNLLKSVKGIAHSFFTPIRRKAGPYEEVPSAKNVARGYFFSSLYVTYGFSGYHFNNAWAIVKKASKVLQVRDRTENNEYLKFLEYGEAGLKEDRSNVDIAVDAGKDRFMQDVVYPMAMNILKKGLK